MTSQTAWAARLPVLAGHYWRMQLRRNPVALAAKCREQAITAKPVEGALLRKMAADLEYLARLLAGPALALPETIGVMQSSGRRTKQPTDRLALISAMGRKPTQAR